MPQPNFLTALTAYAPLKESIEPLAEEAYQQQFESFVNIFNDILYSSMRSWEPVKNYSETLYSKCRVIKHLTNVVIETFESIIEYCKEYEETLIDHQEEHQIIKAISETLTIKIENIKDALKSFLQETEEMTYDPKSLNIQDFALEQWDNIKDINLQLAEEFFVDLQSDSQIQQKIAKSVNNYMQLLSKKEMAYKKDRLLFEITTFNDLLNYSIARLKESTEMDVLMYIQVVEEANSMINTTLINYGIRPINPQPHTVFNGKEHEVIMTQHQEGFKKGEIIKVSNQGYHQGGTVIIRASVVVAK